MQQIITYGVNTEIAYQIISINNISDGFAHFVLTV